MQPPSRLLESSDQAGVEKKSEPKNRRAGRASEGVRMGVLGYGISIPYPRYVFHILGTYSIPWVRNSTGTHTHTHTHTHTYIYIYIIVTWLLNNYFVLVPHT
jgi:hypothetical protein